MSNAVWLFFEEHSVAGQVPSEDGSRRFPLCLRPTEALARTLKGPSDVSALLAEDGVAQGLLDLVLERGGLHIRGLPLSTAEDYLAFLTPFGMEYGEFTGGGGPRGVILGPIHNSTFTPAHLSIPFHHELAYLSHSPAALGFFGETPALSGGETPLLDSAQLVRLLWASDPAFITDLRAKGVVYRRKLEDARPTDAASTKAVQRSWQEAMLKNFDPAAAARTPAEAAADRAEAEAAARATGTATIEWVGPGATDPSLPAAMVVTSVVLPGTLQYKGRETFFNAVVLLHNAGQSPPVADPASLPWQVFYGDGSPIPDASVKNAKELMKTISAEIFWEKGDTILIDNKLAMHARNPFTGPRLTLAVIMSKIYKGE
jgi:hypothetical protein